jgi:CBS domain-containing protein
MLQKDRDIDERRTTMSIKIHTPAVPDEQEIRYWMRTPVVTINLAAPLSEALASMHQHNVRRLPVVIDNSELCGMITEGDIRGAEVLSADGVALQTIADAFRRIKVYQVMSKHPTTVSPGTGLREAAMLMIENKIGGLPVIDSNRLVVGIVTESDLFEALVQQLDQQQHPE